MAADKKLFGKPADVFADLPSEKIGGTGTFKAVTGEDYITGQRKLNKNKGLRVNCAESLLL